MFWKYNEKQEENNKVKKYDTIFPLIFFKNDEKIHKESYFYSLDYSSLLTLTFSLNKFLGKSVLWVSNFKY